jgi:hypothetical protein
MSVDATNRIRLCRAVPQQKFSDDVLSLAPRHWDGFLKLDGRACFDHMPIICPYGFGNLRRMNVKVGFPANLVTLHLVAAFVFAVHENVAKFEVLDENDGCRVVQNILPSLFAGPKRLFGPLAFAAFSPHAFSRKIYAPLFHSGHPVKLSRLMAKIRHLTNG